MVYEKTVTAAVKMVSIRVKQRDHETGKIFVAASANVKGATWELIINGGRLAVKSDKRRYSHHSIQR